VGLTKLKIKHQKAKLQLKNQKIIFAFSF